MSLFSNYLSLCPCFSTQLSIMYFHIVPVCKSLSSIMYFHIREKFSFDMLYCLYFGILLNECYVSTLGLYWCFGVVNFNYKK